MNPKTYILRLALAAIVLAATPTIASAQTEDAFTAVKRMGAGWNLGNTLDANSGDTTNMWIEHWTDRTPADYETSWGQPVATRELIHMFHEAGFNAIRVPVTWYPHLGAKFNFNTWQNSIWSPSNDYQGVTMDAAWMKRVHEVVDYVIDEGMYCILNVHHDTGASSAAWLVADEKHYAANRERFETLWRCIASEFKDYDGHLLFEGYNEMLDDYDSWCFASFATPAKYNASVAASAYKAINSYAQSFVNAVRSTGGNNVDRNLIVSTYGACSGSGTWNEHLKDPLKQLAMPEDVTNGHIIFEIHTYPNISNLNNAKKEVDDMISALKKYLVAKGAPVIIGEWGTSNVDNGSDYVSHRADLIEFARYFSTVATQAGMGTFYWMGLSDTDDRAVPQWTQPEVKDAIIKGWIDGGGNSAITLPESDAGSHPQGAVYDLSGRPASAPHKGIVIADGHKRLVLP